MANSLVAQSYAETLLELAGQNGEPEEFALELDGLAQLVRADAGVRRFMESPRIGAGEKKRVLRDALAGEVPELLLRFLLVVTEKRRERLIPQIAVAYRELLDREQGRIRAVVTLAVEAGDALQGEITEYLETRTGRTVIPEFRTDPSILGGIRVRLGDRVLDGSLRRRLAGMRARLLGARLDEKTA
ncbi:MAG: ATP synthase F1 subunit delta [Longimicrobiaceae bacterium]